MKKQNFFLAHKQFTLFFILALVIVGVAVFAPWVAPKDPSGSRDAGLFESTLCRIPARC